MKKILVLDGVSASAVDVLKNEYKIVEKPTCTKEELEQIIAEFDAVILRSATKITKDILSKAHNLKVIGRAGVGVDNIDIKEATKKGIVVVNAPNGNTNAATEHAFALMLSLARHIPQAHKSIQNGLWDRKSFLGVELKGKTLGILGLGRIGAALAIRAQAFSMDILAYDPYLSDERAKELQIKKCELDYVLANSDFLSLHLPLTDETKGMINKTSIAKMKDGIKIINAARGECIVLDDLYEALLSKKVSGAGLDVFENEPLNNHKIISLDNVVLTPHLGASTIEAQVGVGVDVAYSIKDVLNGQMVSSALNAVALSEQMLNKVKPYFHLAQSLGFIASNIMHSAFDEICVEFGLKMQEMDTRILSTMALCGALKNILVQDINLINAPVLAKDLKIHLKEQKSDEDFYIRVHIKNKNNSHFVEGSVLNNEVYINKIDEYCINFEALGVILLIPHDNVPGMIGQIGTILGKANINIKSMQVSKTMNNGENIMAVLLSVKPSKDVFNELNKIAGIHGIKMIDCEKIND